MPKKCPVNPNHTTRLINLGPSLTYDLCEECKEDVLHLAKLSGKVWNDNQNDWVSAQNQPHQDHDEEYEDNYDDNYDEDDQDDFGHYNPNAGVNPPNWNPNPVRTMGQGQRQLVLHNDPNSAAHLVQEILMRVFQKDAMEAQYIMMDAHYHGQAVAFYVADDAEAQRLMDEINRIKTELEQSGRIGSDRVRDIRFTVENRP